MADEAGGTADGGLDAAGGSVCCQGERSPRENQQLRNPTEQWGQRGGACACDGVPVTVESGRLLAHAKPGVTAGGCACINTSATGPVGTARFHQGLLCCAGVSLYAIAPSFARRRARESEYLGAPVSSVDVEMRFPAETEAAPVIAITKHPHPLSSVNLRPRRLGSLPLRTHLLRSLPLRPLCLAVPLRTLSHAVRLHFGLRVAAVASSVHL